MLQMGLGSAWFLPELSPFWVAVVGTVSGCLMVFGIVALAVQYKQRMQEMEHTLQLRRMEHERRMKELEIELARLQSGMTAARQ